MERKFGFRDKIGYMFGDFGNDFFFMLASTFLMVFYTKVLGISAAAVGTLFLVGPVCGCIYGYYHGTYRGYCQDRKGRKVQTLDPQDVHSGGGCRCSDV